MGRASSGPRWQQWQVGPDLTGVCPPTPIPDQDPPASLAQPHPLPLPLHHLSRLEDGGMCSQVKQGRKGSASNRLTGVMPTCDLGLASLSSSQ